MAEIAREVESSYPHADAARPAPGRREPTIATSIAEAATRAADELYIPFIVDRHDDRQHGASHRGVPPAARASSR